MNFKITYPSGLVEHVGSSDWATAEDVARHKFGTTLEEVQGAGTVIESMAADEQPADVAQDEQPADVAQDEQPADVAQDEQTDGS
jgi:hypothetical protein